MLREDLQSATKHARLLQDDLTRASSEAALRCEEERREQREEQAFRRRNELKEMCMRAARQGHDSYSTEWQPEIDPTVIRLFMQAGVVAKKAERTEYSVDTVDGQGHSRNYSELEISWSPS